MNSKEVVLTIRQNLVSWFKKYEYLIIPIIRFILSFSVLRMLKQATDYEGALGSLVILLGLSVAGAFISAEGIIVCLILLATLFISSSNIILGIIVFLALCMVYILFAHLFPEESLLIIAILVAFPLNLELLVPLVAALFGSYVSIIAILLGTMIWFTMPVLMQTLPTMTMDKAEILNNINNLLAIDYKGMLVNKEMLIMCVIFFIVFTCVYIFRKAGIDYGPYIGIFVGAIMNILGFVFAKVFFVELSFELISIILFTLLFACIASVAQFFKVVLDYQRAENVHFEDDDNFYFVKIIPKIQLSAKKKTVKHIYTDKDHNKPTDMQTERERINRMIMDDDYKF